MGFTLAFGYGTVAWHNAKFSILPVIILKITQQSFRRPIRGQVRSPSGPGGGGVLPPLRYVHKTGPLGVEAALVVPQGNGDAPPPATPLSGALGHGPAKLSARSST